MTYLIDTDDFTSRVDISSNRLLTKINAQIAPAQVKYLKNILCTELYEDLVTQYADGEAYMDERLQALYPFVVDFLVFKTYARYLVGANVIDTPSGSRVKADSGVDRAATAQERKDIRAQADDDANFYQDELVAYLKRNQDTFTEWRDSQCGCDARFVNKMNNITVIGKQSKEVISKNRIDYT